MENDGILEIGPRHFIDLDRIAAMADMGDGQWWYGYEYPPISPVNDRDYMPFEAVFAAWKARKRQKARIELASRSLIAGCSMAKALEEADALLEAAQE